MQYYSSSDSQDSPFSPETDSSFVDTNFHALRGLSAVQSTINRLFAVVEKKKPQKDMLQSAIEQCVARGQYVSHARRSLQCATLETTTTAATTTATVVSQATETEEQLIRRHMMRIAAMLAFGTFDEDTEEGGKKFTITPESLNENVAFTLDLTFAVNGDFECAEMDFCVGEDAYAVERGSFGSKRLAMLIRKGWYDSLLAEIRLLLDRFVVLSDCYETAQLHLKVPGIREALQRCARELVWDSDEEEGDAEEEAKEKDVQLELRGESFVYARFLRRWNPPHLLPAAYRAIWTGLSADGSVVLTLEPAIVMSVGEMNDLEALGVEVADAAHSDVPLLDVLCCSDPAAPSFASRESVQRGSEGRPVSVRRAMRVFGMKVAFEHHCSTPSSSSSSSSSSVMDTSSDREQHRCSCMVSQLKMAIKDLGKLQKVMQLLRDTVCRNHAFASCFHAPRQIEIVAGGFSEDEERGHADGEVTVEASVSEDGKSLLFGVSQLQQQRQSQPVTFTVCVESGELVFRDVQLSSATSVKQTSDALTRVYKKSHSIPVTMYYLRKAAMRGG